MLGRYFELCVFITWCYKSYVPGVCVLVVFGGLMVMFFVWASGCCCYLVLDRLIYYLTTSKTFAACFS